MPTLQIRDLPEHVYRALELRARRQRRSLAQQAVVELSQVPEVEARRRRLDRLAELRQEIEARSPRPLDPMPEELLAEDRRR